MMAYEKEMIAIVNSCAEAGKKTSQDLAMQGNPQPLYLYVKESTQDKNGELILLADNGKAPAGFVLATDEGLRIDVPYDRFYNWVQSRSTRLPVLACNG